MIASELQLLLRELQVWTDFIVATYVTDDTIFALGNVALLVVLGVWLRSVGDRD